jgi:hypothetical protein
MPQAVAAAVAKAVAAYGYGQVVVAVAYAAAYAATAFAMNKAMQSLSKREDDRTGSSLEVSNIDSAAEGRVIYGSIRVGGVYVIPPLASGANGEYLHQVIALAAHEVSSISSVWLDDTEVTNAEITAITGANTDGKVTGSSKFKDVAWLRRYTGTTTQNVDFILNDAFPSSFTSAFRGRGITYLASTFDWGKGKTYAGGVPNVAALVNGKKCYDPRLDVTPGASPTNAAYIAHTTNPALIWADYKMATTYGMNTLSTDIDWDTVVDAADVCDELVAIPTATTQKRYTFSGVLSTGMDTSENEKFIIDAMMGKIAFEGKWRIFAGAWRAPEFTIDYTDWVAIRSIQTTAPRGESRFNGVVVYHVDPDRSWQRVESFRRYNDTYKTADGGERIWIEMEQPMCLSEYESQRKGEFLLRQSRNGQKIFGVLPPKFMYLRTWDNVTVDFPELGWVSKTFTVAGCDPLPDGSLEVILVEEQEADWDDMLEAEYNAASVSTLPATNPTTPTAPTPFSVTSLLGNLKFNFSEPVVKPLETRYQVLRSPGTLATAGSYSVIWEGSATEILLPADVRSFYWYHGRCVSNSYFSAVDPSTFGTGTRPWIGPEAMPGNRGYPDGEFFFAINSYWKWDNQPSSTSYWLVNNNGVTPQRGYLAISVSNTINFSDGAGVAGQSRIHPLRFDINSRNSERAVACFPGQSGTLMVLARPASVAGGAPAMSVRVVPISVNSPKATAYGAALTTITLNTTIPSSGLWALTIGSFTMPTSTIYDAVTLYLRFNDNIQNDGAYVEIGGAQLSTL